MRGTDWVPLPPKVFDTLLLLLENPGQLVSKDDFFQRVWPDTVVGDVVLAHNISFLRKALQGGATTTFIETVPKRGYRFVAPVETIADASGDVPAIAVLPLTNLSGDPGNDRFADGITEDILNALARHPGLRVAARSSSFAFKHTRSSLADVVDRLHVDFVLEGSVRRIGDRVIVVAQLVRATDGYSLWSERFDRELTDMFAVQHEIANAVSAETVSRSGRPKAAPAPDVTPPA